MVERKAPIQAIDNDRAWGHLPLQRLKEVYSRWISRLPEGIFEESAFLNMTTSNIVGEARKKQAVSAVGAIIGTEFGQVLSEDSVSLGMGVLSLLVFFSL